ncbi:MAG: amidohydrolase/deacetylase family metallohydrolase [Balneolaceae bacterium]
MNPTKKRPCQPGIRRTLRSILTTLLLCLLPVLLQAQSFDILLKGGHLIDPKNGIDQMMDVAIADGKVARVARSIPESDAEQVIDVSGLYVSPGLIDLHTHIFFGTDPYSDQMNSYRSVIPDNFSFRYGITTMVDAGSSGWRNFQLFKDQTIANSRTRIFAMLRITGHGSKGGVYSQNLNDMDPKMAALVARRHPEIVGFKIAHYNGHTWEPIDRLVEAGRLADKPVMIDFGSADPALSLETLFMEKLRPGDIYSHIYGGSPDPNSGREAIIDQNGNVRDFVAAAQERGIIYDVGHGGGSFDFSTAIPAIEQGIQPNTISSDLHMSSLRTLGMQDLNNVMSKMLNIGMSVQEIVQATTWKSAQVIQHEELGHLSEGAIADVWVFGIREGEFGFVDVDRPSVAVRGDRKFDSELTIFGGEVVWDMNGHSNDNWRGE